MNADPNPTSAEVQQQVEAIVAEGQDVRGRVSRLVTAAAEKFHNTQEGLLGLARSVLNGAAAAVDRAVSPDPASTLRQIVDGLGDGLSATALASRLAFEEAEAHGQAFARDDLAKFRSDLRALGDMFVDTVAEAARRLRRVTGAELTSVRDHAAATKTRILPAIESALGAAQKHPLQLGKESVEVGLSLSRQALGGLFNAVGRTLQHAGKRLSGEETTK
jgi:hypothetical protein